MFPGYRNLEDAFNSNTFKTEEHWIWWGTKDKDGYGKLKFNERYLRAQRLSLHLHKGFDLDSDLLVLHTCNRKDCVNPEHLYIGTPLANMQDKMKDFIDRGLLKKMKVGDTCSNGHLIRGDYDIYFHSSMPFGRCNICRLEVSRNRWLSRLK